VRVRARGGVYVRDPSAYGVTPFLNAPLTPRNARKPFPLAQALKAAELENAVNGSEIRGCNLSVLCYNADTVSREQLQTLGVV